MSNLNNEFTQQHTDLTEAYTDMSPGHRSELARAFIDHFRQCHDPGALEYARVDPHYVSSSQLALMHQYAADVHPEILTEVMHSEGVMDAFGGPAASTRQTPPGEGHVSH
jgi:hypothetical protein